METSKNENDQMILALATKLIDFVRATCIPVVTEKSAKKLSSNSQRFDGVVIRSFAPKGNPSTMFWFFSGWTSQLDILVCRSFVPRYSE